MKSHALKGAVVGATLGFALGVGACTFIYAKGGSYLTNNPAACANCHIMQEHYVDFIEAENSMGYHAPQEAARILAESIDASRKGRAALRTRK